MFFFLSLYGEGGLWWDRVPSLLLPYYLYSNIQRKGGGGWQNHDLPRHEPYTDLPQKVAVY